eukprot:6214649-Pleurochrysis_carterae.AAC.4
MWESFSHQISVAAFGWFPSTALAPTVQGIGKLEYLERYEQVANKLALAAVSSHARALVRYAELAGRYHQQGGVYSKNMASTFWSQDDEPTGSLRCPFPDGWKHRRVRVMQYTLLLLAAISSYLTWIAGAADPYTTPRRVSFELCMIAALAGLHSAFRAFGGELRCERELASLTTFVCIVIGVIAASLDSNRAIQPPAANDIMSLDLYDVYDILHPLTMSVFLPAFGVSFRCLMLILISRLSTTTLMVDILTGAPNQFGSTVSLDLFESALPVTIAHLASLSLAAMMAYLHERESYDMFELMLQCQAARQKEAEAKQSELRAHQEKEQLKKQCATFLAVPHAHFSLSTIGVFCFSVPVQDVSGAGIC